MLNDADTKKKYSSRVAELYREELARRVKDDVARYVPVVFVRVLGLTLSQIPERNSRRWC